MVRTGADVLRSADVTNETACNIARNRKQRGSSNCQESLMKTYETGTETDAQGHGPGDRGGDGYVDRHRLPRAQRPRHGRPAHPRPGAPDRGAARLAAPRPGSAPRGRPGVPALPVRADGLLRPD